MSDTQATERTPIPSDQTRELRERLSKRLVPKLEKYVYSEFGDIERLSRRQGKEARERVCRKLGVCWSSYTNWTKRGVLPSLANLMSIQNIIRSSFEEDPAEGAVKEGGDEESVEITEFPVLGDSESSIKAYFLQVDKYFDLASQHMSMGMSDDELCAAKWRACMSRMGR